MTDIDRTVFTTSRLLEFTTKEELTKLVGFDPDYWPVVVVKELTDNALDACEEAHTAPEISIAVSTTKGTISVSDNGLGITADTVTKLLDYTKKTSSREAYVAPTRGAQGNALQSLLAMPFTLSGGDRGETVIKSQGISHNITFTADPVRREPKIENVQRPSSIHSGTSVTVHWPELAGSQLADAKGEIVSVANKFAWLNPHAAFTLRWDGKVVLKIAATDPGWCKWLPGEPTPASWYDIESFSRLIAACVAHDEDHGRDRTVRDFIAEFRGLQRTDVRAQVLDDVGAARTSLREFFTKPQRVQKLLTLMQEMTKSVPAKDLGLLGRGHFLARFVGRYVDAETFQYRRALCDIDGVPYAIEAAFGYCPRAVVGRQQIIGVNWSPSLLNPIRDLASGDSLDSVLFEQRVGAKEPIILAVHIASPCIAYTDKAKSALSLPDTVAVELEDVVRSVTKKWAKVRKAEERDDSRRERRLELLTRSHNEKQRDVAFELMPDAYAKVSGPKNLWANARQIMYSCRGEIQKRSDKTLGTNYFTQTLLPDFLKANPRLTAKWKIAYDDRGHFADPHSGLMIGLGTVAVRNYIEKVHELEIKTAAIASAHVKTLGPHGAYSGVLYIEKEGFQALFDEVQLAQRFDLAIMSCKGNSVIAARELVDEICHRWNIPLFILHDFDKAGFSIRAGFMQKQSRRYTFQNRIKVYDLGLRMVDVRRLIDDGKDEKAAKSKASPEKRYANMRKNGATHDEADYLLTRRVELNAFTSEELVEFIERKLTEHNVKKIVPSKTDLAATYRTMSRGREVEKLIKRELKKLDSTSPITVPRDLKEQVEDYLEQHPEKRWDAAVAAIVKVNKEGTAS